MFFFRQLNEEKTRSSKSQETLQIAPQHTLKPTPDHLGPVTFSYGNQKTAAEILTTGCATHTAVLLSSIGIILTKEDFLLLTLPPSQKNKAPIKRKPHDALNTLSWCFFVSIRIKTLLSQNVTSGHLKSHQNKFSYLNNERSRDYSPRQKVFKVFELIANQASESSEPAEETKPFARNLSPAPHHF